MDVLKALKEFAQYRDMMQKELEYLLSLEFRTKLLTGVIKIERRQKNVRD